MTRTITVPVENKPGTLANICKALAKENINIEAFCSEGFGETGFVRLLTSDPEKCAAVLKRQGLPVTTTETFEITVPNKPGELARVCAELGRNNVNIESAFGTAAEGESDGRIVFHVNNPEAARRVFTNVGARVVQTTAR